VGLIDPLAERLGVVERLDQMRLVAVQSLQGDLRSVRPAGPGRVADRVGRSLELGFALGWISVGAVCGGHYQYGRAQLVCLLQRRAEVIAGASPERLALVRAVAPGVVQPAQRRNGEAVRLEELSRQTHIQRWCRRELDRRITGPGHALDRLGRARRPERPL